MSAEKFGSDRMWGLKDPPLPEPVSWFALTPGTVLLAGILLSLVGLFVWRRWQAWQRNRYRRIALAELSAMEDSAAGLAGLPTVLRRIALTAFPRVEVASLRGADWVAWLNEKGARFEDADAAWLDRLPYDPDPGDLSPDVAKRLLSTSSAWVREHRARV